MLFFGFGLVCKGDTVMRNRRLARSPSKHILVWSHEYGCAFVGLLQDILPGVREGMICVIVTGCERFDEESRTWVSFPDQRFEWKPVPSIPVDHPYLDGEPTLLFVEGYLTSSSGGAEGLKHSYSKLATGA